MTEENNQSVETILPAYELIKRNILFEWFEIQSEYKKFMRINGANKSYRIEYLSSAILSLYATMLSPVMPKHNYGEFAKELEGYIQNNYTIPSTEINKVVNQMTAFLHKSKMLDIGVEVTPFDERFRKSYGM